MQRCKIKNLTKRDGKKNIAIMKVSFLVVLVMLVNIGESMGASARRNPGATAVVETDPFELHPCKLYQKAETLEELWVYVTQKIRSNTRRPGQLVRDMVDLACIQRNLFSHSDGGGVRSNLKARFSNSVYPFLSEVVDNFKIGLKHLQDQLASAETAAFSDFISALPASSLRRIINLDQRLKKGNEKEDAKDRYTTHTNIRTFVDVRSLLVERFIAAYPLLIEVTKQIQETHDEFKGKRANRFKTKATAEATTTTSKPTSSSKKKL